VMAKKSEVHKLAGWLFGWLSLKEAERYTRGAERKKLAERGMGLLVPLKARTESV
jgi:hypothetical protein